MTAGAAGDWAAWTGAGGAGSSSAMTGGAGAAALTGVCVAGGDGEDCSATSTG
jgi:hypothetical protein